MFFVFKLLTISILIKTDHAILQEGYHRLLDFPPPDFTQKTTLATEGYQSFKEIEHNFKKLPFYVRVYATSKDGDNAGFLFEGNGVTQNDGRDSGPFGGVLFAYNEKTIRIWVPSQGFKNKESAVIFVGRGWGGNINSQSSLIADIIIEAWKDGPDPTFQLNYELDSYIKSEYQLIHGLRQLPDLINIRVSSANKLQDTSYVFHGTGASQVPKSSKVYGGVIFAYNEHKIQLWTPSKSKSSGCIMISKYWGEGKYAPSLNSQSCRVNIRIWLSVFPAPILQTEWLSLAANQHKKSFYEVSHTLSSLPLYVKVQYRFPNTSQSLIFEATGNVQSSELNGNQYGGVTYAFDKSKVRIWLPSSVKENESYAIFVGDGWGNATKEWISEEAEIKISIYTDKCQDNAEMVDPQGFCRDISEVGLVHQMSGWSKCSNPCGEGTKSRTMETCTGRSMQKILSCSFEKDFCGFQITSGVWVRSRGAKNEFEKKLQIPTYGTPKGSYFVFTNTVNSKPDDRASLMSQLFDDLPNCLLSFKYTTGAYFGTIVIDVLSSNGKWNEEVWFMKDDETRGPNIWLNGFVNIGERVGLLRQFRISQDLNPYVKSCPDQCLPISLTNILVQCEKPNYHVMEKKECLEKEKTLSSCLFNVFKPHMKGKAWSVSQPLNLENKTIGTYITANGANGDIIASYTFYVKRAGAYFLWLDSFALTNATNGITVQISHGSKVSRNLIWNKESALWLPLSHEFVLDAGEHTLILYQMEKGFCYRNIMVSPKTITTWYDLGMQSHFIPDNNFDSLTGSHLNVVHSRLNGIAAWMPTDNTHFYLQIRLVDLALVSKIATQGGTWLDSGDPFWFCATKVYKLKISLDGKSFVHYRNSSLIKVHHFRGNDIKNASQVQEVVEHYLDYALPIRAIRFYPLNFTHSGCLRVELYGHYINQGMCPSITSRVKEKSCVGDGECPLKNSKCRLDRLSNQTFCECISGYHGNDCQQKGCRKNLCFNNGSCTEENGNFQCTCKHGFYGQLCKKKCPQGWFGFNCASKCKCNDKDVCNPIDGSCSCPPGFIGRKCDHTCSNNTFGNKCLEKCSCPSFMTCDHVDGKCYCPNGYYGDKCQETCLENFYGRNCTKKCSCQNNAVCDSKTGDCDCAKGWIGPQCKFKCPLGRYGKLCSHKCDHPENSTCDPVFGNHTCNPGLKGRFCHTPCDSYEYGSGCIFKCACKKENTKSCDAKTGKCACNDGYAGERCQYVCQSFHWGSECKRKCKCKNGAFCDHVTGKCTCLNGYIGDLCENTCASGFYGRDCVRECKCNNQFTEECDPETGECRCNPGYQGQNCDQKCGSEKWGENCNNLCRCVNDAKCDHRDGYCYCNAGYEGQFCESTCKNGTYGVNCVKKCQCKNNADCGSADGHCECLAGFEGTFCEQKCRNFFYGLHCLGRCNCIQKNTDKCDHVNGTCFCLPGYNGVHCEKECLDGFYGAHCLNRCPTCYHSNGPCDKRIGNCSCSDGFTGRLCDEDCSWSHYGAKCLDRCQCNSEQLCSNIDGKCYSKAGHIYNVYLLKNEGVLTSTNLKKVISFLTDLFSSCFVEFNDAYMKNESLPTCVVKTPNKNIRDFIIRVVDEKKAFTQTKKSIASLSLSVLNKNVPVSEDMSLKFLEFYGYANLSLRTEETFYVGPVIEAVDDDSDSSITKWIIIGASCGAFLLLVFSIYAGYRCIQGSDRPASFHKIKRESLDDPVELTPCLMKANSHLLAFDNPYYDVIAAMGFDDEIEEDYLNPLFEYIMTGDSDGEIDDMNYAYRSDYHSRNDYNAYRNEMYYQPRNYYPYDVRYHTPYEKDSGFSSGSLER